MASDTSLDDLKSWNVNHYTNLIPFSIILYDYCITFGVEVERFWNVPRLNWALAFFYLNRYLVLFGHVPLMLEYFWSTSSPNKTEICHHLGLFHQYLVIAVQMVVACIVIMRVYALYERSRRVLVFYVTVAVVISAVASWLVLGGKKEKPRTIQVRLGCGGALSREKAMRFGVAWVGLLVFDSLVFGMTVYKSMVLPRPSRGNLLDILLRDGAIYFGVMMACHLANILTFMLSGPLTRGGATTFANVISSLMISRFMLNLRDPSLLSEETTPFIASQAESTYPITTIFEVEHSTRVSGEEEIE